MKPIIIDMQEISLSKEVYGKGPRASFTVLMYCLLVFVIVFFAWMYFGYVDIVIRAQGVIRPHGVTATVINPISGLVSDVLFYEGQKVSQGDTLYVINPSLIGSDTDEIVIYAPIDGEVSVVTELIKNNYAMNGTHILSINPSRGDVLDAYIFINSHDIGRINEGMMVSYNISDLPHQNNQKITGYIDRITSNAPSNQFISDYFLAVSEIDDKIYYDTQGNSVTLRVGMTFEAQIILERRRVLLYLLNILNI